MVEASGISIDIDGRKVLRAIKKMGHRFDNKEFLHLVGQDTLNWVNKNFRSQGALGGKKWKGMSPNTKIARRKKGKGAKLLRDTGALSQSFIFNVKVLRGLVEVGSADKKALWHQEGTKATTITAKGGGLMKFKTTRGWQSVRSVDYPGIPARPMLPDEKNSLEILNRSTSAFLKMVAKGL